MVNYFIESGNKSKIDDIKDLIASGDMLVFKDPVDGILIGSAKNLTRRPHKATNQYNISFAFTELDFSYPL